MNELWVDKYKPNSLDEIIFQKKAVEQVLNFVKNFKKGKALFLFGPTGIGKSVIVETLAKTFKYNLIRVNANDKRTSGEIDKIITTSKIRDLFHAGKIILVDEMEGLSGGDRGAVGAIVKLIKESRFPVFLAGSDPYLAKLKSLRPYCILVKMSKIPTPSIEKKLREIAQKEGIKVDDMIIKNLARFSQGDIRSAIMDLQTLAKTKSINKEDVEMIGYRDRESNVFEVLPAIFSSGTLSAARKIINNSDKDPEELFYWVENNIYREFTGEEIAKAYDIISNADIFRMTVLKQRNYRFRAYMLDLLAALATIRGYRRYGYVAYQPPKYFLDLARARFKRAFVNNLCKKIGNFTHSSIRSVKINYLNYLKFIVANSKEDSIEGMDLEKDEIEFLRN